MEALTLSSRRCARIRTHRSCFPLCNPLGASDPCNVGLARSSGTRASRLLPGQQGQTMTRTSRLSLACLVLPLLASAMLFAPEAAAPSSCRMGSLASLRSKVCKSGLGRGRLPRPISWGRKPIWDSRCPILMRPTATWRSLLCRTASRSMRCIMEASPQALSLVPGFVRRRAVTAGL